MGKLTTIPRQTSSIAWDYLEEWVRMKVQEFIQALPEEEVTEPLGRYHASCPACGKKVERVNVREKDHRPTRTVPIDRSTLEMIKEYLDRGGPASINGRQLLFGISRGRARRIIKECAQRVGLPRRLVDPESGKVHGVSPHKLDPI